MRRFRIGWPVAAFTAVLVLLTAPRLWSQGGTTTAAATTLPAVTTQQVTTGGVVLNRILVGNAVVMDIRAGAGGYSASERAAIVASRLSSLLNLGYTGRDVTSVYRSGDYQVLLGNNVLVTVSSADARATGMSQSAVASTWRNTLRTGLQTALAGVPPVTPPNGNPPPVDGGSGGWPAWTNPTSKIVPIIAAGNTGVSLGAAQVTGPSAMVDRVRSVVALQANFQNTARVYVFVPSSEQLGLNRVQGVAVSALLQFTLFRL